MSKRNVTISEADGYVNGHGYVDLGLPSGIKWATCNVGANSPDKAGGYYSWGEIETKKDYSKATSKTVGLHILDFSGNPTYDVAASKWGNRWCMPTLDNTDELVKQCKWTWIKYNSTTGYKVTGPNGKSIFLPAKGWKNGSEIMDSGQRGLIWTSISLDEEISLPYTYEENQEDFQEDFIKLIMEINAKVNYEGSCGLSFEKFKDNNDLLERRIGANVRPVIR